MKERTERWVEFMPGATASERERNFFVIFGGMLGAVSIARLFTESADRERVLAGTRNFLLQSF
jgi:TetR/AcrR family transcriptional regulator, transcriptional repressor for nem operon